MNSPPEPNKRLLSVGSILLLYQTTSSPSKTLFAGCHRRQDSREAAVSQPNGRPGSQRRRLSPPPAWQRPLGKVTGSLVIPAGKNSRGRGAGACARGGTGGAAEPPKPGEQSQTPFLSQNKTKS